MILILFSHVLVAHLSLESSAYLRRMLTIPSSSGWTSVEPYPTVPRILINAFFLSTVFQMLLHPFLKVMSLGHASLVYIL